MRPIESGAEIRVNTPKRISLERGRLARKIRPRDNRRGCSSARSGTRLAVTRRMRCSLVALLVLFFVSIAAAIQVGQTRETIVAQYGAPTEENHAKNTAIYRQGQWKVDVTYKDDTAQMLTFTKVDPLTESEIASILAQNSDGGTWHELNMGTTTRHWQGSDVKIAQADRVNPRSIRISDTPFRAQVIQAAAAAKSVRAAFTAATPMPAVRPASTKVVAESATGPSAARPVPAGAVVATMMAGMTATIVGALLMMALPALGLLFFLKCIVPMVVRHGAAALSRKDASPTAGATQAVRLDKILGRVSPTSSSNAAPAWTPPKPDEPTLDTMGWQNFELLVGELFRRKGYSVEITSGLGADGGKDLTLRKDGQLFVVQCKKLARENRVTAAQMRDFFGLITAEGAAGGFFVTTGYISADARRFAEGKPIDLIERAEIEAMVQEVSSPDENLCSVASWIDTFAAHSHVVDPICPFCESRMQLKRGALGRPFWGCVRYATHRCRGKRDGRGELLAALRSQQR